MKNASKIIGIAAVAALTACGGGGDESPSDSSRFVTWKDSANGIVVKDAADEGFGVETQSRAVVHIAKNSTLRGLAVNGNAQVLANGALIGSVLLNAATNGAQIAVFKCNDGTGMRLTLSSDASSWSHNCTGAVTPPTPPNPSTPPSAGINASDCLKVSRDLWDRLQFTNTCNQRVYYTYCLVGGDSIFRCGGLSSGGDYGQGSGSVSAGGTAVLPDSASASGVRAMGCAQGNSGAQPIAHLTSINPPEGRCQ